MYKRQDRSLNGRYKLLEDGNAEVSASTQLVGGVSLIIGSTTGGLALSLIHIWVWRGVGGKKNWGGGGGGGG
ncbi:hypothetical protein QN388_25185, partial [Pseudomonas sp. 5B4]